METANFAIQPYPYKFTFWKANVNKNFREFIRFFSNMFEPPINSVHIQKQFASWNFNSNSVWKLNLLPKGKMSTMIQYTLIQSLEHF
jgi:hypothetical protein